MEAALNGRTNHDILDAMLRVEAVAQGFAGYFLDKDSALVARLVRPENEGRLRAAIAELMAWQDEIWQQIVRVDVVTAIAVDIINNKVRIGIVHANGSALVQDLVRKLEVPDDAVRIEVVGQPRTL